MNVPRLPAATPNDRDAEDAFDRALARAARSLVVAPIPEAVLDAPGQRTVRPWRQFGGPLAAAVLVSIASLAIAVTVGIGFPLSPGSSTSSDAGGPFRTTDQVSFDLRALGFACRAGAAALPREPRMEAAVCTSTADGVDATVVLSEDGKGGIGEAHIRLDMADTPTAAGVRRRSALLRETIGLPFSDPSTATAVRSWLDTAMPLDPVGRAATTMGGIPVSFEHDADGSYNVVLGDLRAGAGPTPTG